MDNYLNRPRHPDFDRAWRKHRRLVFWAGRRMARALGGRPEEYWGVLTLIFNYVLHYYREEKGSFANFFLRGLRSKVVQSALHYDGEACDVRVSQLRSNKPRRRVFHDSTFGGFNAFAYRHPDVTDDWMEGLLEGMGAGAWNGLTAGLPERLEVLLEERFLKGRKLDAVARGWGVSRQRVHQLEAKALGKVGAGVREKFPELF